MQTAWGPVGKKASVCWNQMQMDILTLEVWWANSRRDVRLWLYSKQPGSCSHCFAWEWQTSCRSSTVVRLHFSSTSLTAATGRKFIFGAAGNTFYVIYPFTSLQCSTNWIWDSERNRFLPLLCHGVIPDHPAGHSSIACLEQTAVC